MPYKTLTIKDVANGVEFKTASYFIGWERLDSHRKLCAWLTHMLEKTWFTREHALELIEATYSHFEWKRDPA